MLPRGLGIKKGHSDSLAIRLQGPSATATHLRTAARNSGELVTDGGVLTLAGKGVGAMQNVRAADRDDVAMAKKIIGDKFNPSMLAQREEYLVRQKQQENLGSYDDGTSFLVQALLPHCKRLRKLRDAGFEWYGYPTWMATHTFGAGRITLQRFSYHCETVPASLITSENGRRGFTAEQVDEWHRNGAVQTALGGAQAAKPGGKPPKQCTNSWCKREIAYAGFARHVRECKAKHAAGGELGPSHHMTATQRKEQDARGRSLGY